MISNECEATIKYHDFKANGLNDILTEDQKKEIKGINKIIENINSQIELKKESIKTISSYTPTKTRTTVKNETYTRKLLALDIDYTPEQIVRIFSGGKSNYKLWFLNSKKYLCIIDKCYFTLYGDNTTENIVVSVTIDVKNINKKYVTVMYLDRFLFLVESGDFTITNKKFNDTYFKPYSDSIYIKHEKDYLLSEIEQLNEDLKEIQQTKTYKKYDKLYKEYKKEIEKEYKEITKSEVREKPQDKAQQLKKKESLDLKMNDVKTIWNSTLTKDERRTLISWISNHIYSIRIKVVKDGISDKVLSKAYPDEIYGKKYREKANSSGWDASSGVLTFNTVEGAPIELFKKISTIKHLRRTKDKGETIFNGNKINNLNLALFLLSNYNHMGFKSGVKNLKSSILLF